MELGEKDYKLLEHYCAEGQNPADVRRIYQAVQPAISSYEIIQGIYVQCKPILRGAAVVTQWRLMFYQPKLFGGAYMEEFGWGGLVLPQVEEHLFFSTFLINLSERTGTPKTIGMSWLPKQQALKLLSWARAQFRFWDDEWRIRDLQDARAKAGTFLFPGAVDPSNPIENIAAPIEPIIKDPLDTEKKLHMIPQNLPKSSIMPMAGSPFMPHPMIGTQPQLQQPQQAQPAQQVSLSIRLQKIVQDGIQQLASANVQPDEISISEKIIDQPMPMHQITYQTDAKKPPKIERLKKLKELLDQGLISNEDYMARRKEILDEV